MSSFVPFNNPNTQNGTYTLAASAITTITMPPVGKDGDLLHLCIAITALSSSDVMPTLILLPGIGKNINSVVYASPDINTCDTPTLAGLLGTTQSVTLVDIATER